MNYQQAFIDHYKAVRARISNAAARPPAAKTINRQIDGSYPDLPVRRPAESSPKLEILRQCATEFGCTVSEIMSENKISHVMLARRKAMWLLHQRGTMSKSAIGRYMNKDHTTVIHAIRAYEKSLAQGEAK